jgi:hypothetical protein
MAAEATGTYDTVLIFHGCGVPLRAPGCLLGAPLDARAYAVLQPWCVATKGQLKFVE